MSIPESPLDLVSFQALFNAELTAFFDAKLAEYTAIHNAPLFIEALTHARSILFAGGKRIRPYMSYLTYATEEGKQQKNIVQVGIALELFHLFALVHDDIIDKGLTRHGVSTTHTFVAEKIGSVPLRDTSHIADGIALLIGDLIFSWSYEIIAGLHDIEISHIFSRMVSEVVAGQALDVAFMVSPGVTLQDILKKNELKTARYTFVEPMQIGRALAKSTAHEATYTDLGLALGQAFQMQDDLLDIVGTAKVTGKQPCIDIEDGQHTLLTQYVFDLPEDGTAHTETLRSMFGKKLSDTDRAMLRTLFSDTGAIAYAQHEIDTLLGRAEASVKELPETHSAEWNRIIALLRARVA